MIDDLIYLTAMMLLFITPIFIGEMLGLDKFLYRLVFKKGGRR